MGQAERNKGNTWVQAFSVGSDVAAILIGFLLGYWARFHSSLSGVLPAAKGVPPVGMYLGAAAVTIAIWIPLFHVLGLYRLERGHTRHRRADLTRALVLGGLALAAAAFFYRGASFSRIAMVLIWCATSALVLAGRTIVQSLAPHWAHLRPIRFALVGDGPLAARLR
ncbi:MAG: hypothetical protein KC729_14750, partial [Candidatus Eisenbacteria bacterium]|nr:hypothetical protein [Candidatus Eisenbacteria bacterium]